MHHGQLTAPVHRMQLRELRVQCEGVVERECWRRELRERTARGGEVRVADRRHGRQAVEPAAQQHEDEALCRGGGGGGGG